MTWRSPAARRLLLLGGSTLLMLVLVRTASHASWERIALGPAALAMGLAVLGNSVLCGWRWAVVAALPARSAIRWYLEATFFSVMVPGGVGGDVYRVRCDAERGVSRSTTLVAADRVLGGLTTLIVAVPCAFVALPRRDAGWLAAGALLLTVALVAVRRPLAVRLEPVRSIGHRRALGSVAITAGYLLVFAVVLRLLAVTVGWSGSWPQALAWAPLVALAGMLPSVHGLGPTQGAFALYLAALGAPGAVAATGATVSLLTLLLAGAVGAVAYALRLAARREEVIG